MNELIKVWRTEANMSQEELGKRIAMSAQGVSLLEKGKRTVSLDCMKRIATIFGKEIVIHVQEQAVSSILDDEQAERELLSRITIHVADSLEFSDIRQQLITKGNRYFAKASDWKLSRVIETVCELIETQMAEETIENAVLHLEAGTYVTFEDIDEVSDYFYARTKGEAKLIIASSIQEEIKMGYTIRLGVTTKSKSPLLS